MKKIYDPLHGFIRCDATESLLIESLPFQRLHWIHQLGIAHLVFPGGTHTRFEHSLGAMQLATRIYDRITEDFAQKIGDFPSEVQKSIPKVGSKEWHFWRRILRLAALCHDLGHLPFSHAAEKILLAPKTHEDLSAWLIEHVILQPVWRDLGESAAIAMLITKISVGPNHCPYDFTPFEKILSQMITADLFGADRMDYLLRDAQATGVAHGTFDFEQLIETLSLYCEEERGDLGIGIDPNGVEACEALLLSRYFMYKRIYQHPSVKAYNFHLARFMKRCYGAVPTDLEDFIPFTDAMVQNDLHRAAFDRDHPCHFDALPFFFKEKRFSAISVKNSLDERQLGGLQEALGLSESVFGYDIYPHSQPKAPGFPVLMPKGGIAKGHEVSDLLIPTPRTSWIYVPAALEEIVKEKIGSDI